MPIAQAEQDARIEESIEQDKRDRENASSPSYSSPSSSSSSPSSYKSSMECEWCGKSFNKGGGYNTLMRQINSPAMEYSSYCSRKCATGFLRNN